jgi:Zn-finger nucleic acid-binding protein
MSYELFCPVCKKRLAFSVRDGWAIADCTKCSYRVGLREALYEGLLEEEVNE